MSQLSTLLRELIQDGDDIQANKYFEASTAALLFYDYTLTLEDEIRYAWGGRKTWIFYLYILNRYLPMAYKIWVTIGDYWPNYTLEFCTRSAALQPAFFVWSTLSAQMFLMVRVYVLNGRNKVVLGGFILMTTIQAVAGILIIAVSSHSIVRPPAIPLDVFQVCVFDAKRGYEVAYVLISLLYDTVAFVLIIRLSRRGVAGISTTTRTIAKDAAVYFMVIFTMHIILSCFVLFARESLRLTPAIGINILIPLMVTRLILSLRKASDPETIAQWNVDHFTDFHVTTTEDYASPSDTQGPATRHAAKIEVADPVLELSNFENQAEQHPGALDSEV